MTYIITLTQEQFTALYNYIVECGLPDGGILAAMDSALDHHNEREAVLKELVGITT